MNCYKGICKYKTDNTNLCIKDKDEGKKPSKCDMIKDNQYIHKCHFGYVTCADNCYMFDNCQET